MKVTVCGGLGLYASWSMFAESFQIWGWGIKKEMAHFQVGPRQRSKMLLGPGAESWQPAPSQNQAELCVALQQLQGPVSWGELVSVTVCV